MRHTVLLVLLFAGSAVSAQNAFDATIRSYEGLRFACEGGAQPNLKIQNLGTNTMSTCVVETWKNGLLVNSFNWVLVVPAATGDIRQPALPQVSDVAFGDELEFRIRSVNGVPDQGAEGNELAVQFDQVPKYAQGGDVVVEVETGSDPGEVQWKLVARSGQTVAQGGPYTAANTTIQVPVALNDQDCYRLLAEDQGRGVMSDVQLRLHDAQGVIITIQGSDLAEPVEEGVRTGTGEPCTQQLVLEFVTDNAGSETSWVVSELGSAAVLCSGEGLPDGAVLTADCCLPEGCYTLRVLDAGGDGMVTGGYVLRTQGTSERIIDNRNNFSNGSVSAISGGQGFCLPMSDQGLVYTSCDKLDWINGQYVVARPNPAVSAEWIVNGASNVQDNNSGYEFWIFDPNGSYSFRRLRSHNVSDGFGPASATRACHMKVNNWGVASHVPANVLMNVRVRARINGVNGEFGPACRLMIDPARAACPLTKLMDIPGNQFFSCGVFRNWGPNNYVHARPVGGADRYQFRFRIAAEGYEVVRQTTTYFVQLNWTANAGPRMEVGKTYDVDVRVSKDGGITWCGTDDPWGNVCQVTIGTAELNANSQADVDLYQTNGLQTYPHPSDGGAFFLSLPSALEGRGGVQVELFTLSGARVRTLNVEGSGPTVRVDPVGHLPAGIYLVHVISGGHRYSIRHMVSPQ